MVFSDIEENGRIGPECLNRLELKTAYFENDIRGMFTFDDVIDKGIADIASNEDITECLFEYFTDEGCSRCFSVCSCDGDDWFFYEYRREFYFPNDPDLFCRASLSTGSSLSTPGESTIMG